MIKYRSFIVFVVAVALLALSARTGYAAPFSCVANAAVPPTIRVEGLAERVGDLVLACFGGIAGSPITVNLTVFLNTAVTSRIITPPATSEALLLIDEPAPAAQVLNANVFQGLVSGNQITWPNISFTAPGDFAHRIFRFTNLRAHAIGLSGSPYIVQALVSVSGNAGMPISYPTQIMAFGQRGLNFSADSASFSYSLAPGADGNPTQFSITFSETFPTAFKKKIEGTYQNIPGLIYNTESGFTSSVTGAAGLADSGTRLVARFSSIPSGVSLSVPVTVTYGTFTAVLMTGVAQDFSGGIPAVSGDIVLSGGSGVAVWEITDENPLAAQNITFPVTVSYAPGISGGKAFVSGSLGPVSTNAAASSSNPLPRFNSPAGAVTAFVISVPVPTLGEWGMILFMLLAGALAVYHLRKSEA